MAERVPILDARFFTTAVLTQRETGGNLSEILDNLAAVIRDRFKVKRQVRAVTAHGRITGWILAGLPPVLALILSIVSPEHMKPMITDPLGIKMIAVGGTMQVIGTLIIRKLVNIRVLGVLVMALDLLVTLVAGFLAVALLAGYGDVQHSVRRSSPERRRLRQLATAGGPARAWTTRSPWSIDVDPRFKSLPGIPKSPKEMGRLRRRLAMAGYTSPTAVVLYALANLVSPVCSDSSPWPRSVSAADGSSRCSRLRWVTSCRECSSRGRSSGASGRFVNGLPDALDLFIVCVEAGSGLDQAIVKASDELGSRYPALAYELRLITTEIRAGKPRVEAFKNFAARTKVDDVQSLVALLVQTDKFGTSMAQALRTHADTSRTKRRQRAEERAGKVGVKLVFPLVLFLFPALYIVILGRP